MVRGASVATSRPAIHRRQLDRSWRPSRLALSNYMCPFLTSCQYCTYFAVILQNFLFFKIIALVVAVHELIETVWLHEPLFILSRHTCRAHLRPSPVVVLTLREKGRRAYGRRK